MTDMLEVVFYLLFSAICAVISIYFFYIAHRNRLRAKQAEEQRQQELIRAEQERIEAELQERKKQEEQNRKEKEEREKHIAIQKELFQTEILTIPAIFIPTEICSEKSKQSIEQIQNISFSRITKRTNIERLFPLVVIDVETTGLHHRNDEIIEVSAIKYESCFTPDSCFTTLCKPNKPIPLSATNINHITNEMVSNAPTFCQIADSLSDFISGCNLVGHNLYFDLKFLCANGISFSNNKKFFDTLELSRYCFNCGEFFNYRYNAWMDVYSFKLDTLCEYINVFRDDSHRSLSDCLATGKLFENIVSRKTTD